MKEKLNIKMIVPMAIVQKTGGLLPSRIIYIQLLVSSAEILIDYILSVVAGFLGISGD